MCCLIRCSVLGSCLGISILSGLPPTDQMIILTRMLLPCSMMPFRDGGVHEIAFTNRRFTWSNHQPSPILVRLDRFFVNNLWCQAYPSSSSVCLTAPVSNHAPILLTASTNVPRPVVFRFNNHWIHYHEFNSIVQSAWESVASSQPSLSQSAKLCLCLKRSRADLKAWSKQLRQPDQVLANCNLVVGMMDAL